MKPLVIFTSLLLAVGAVAAPQEQTSVSIRNAASSYVVVWVNGSERTLAPASGMIVPCITGETVELQTGDQIEFIACGERREVNQ